MSTHEISDVIAMVVSLTVLMGIGITSILYFSGVIYFTGKIDLEHIELGTVVPREYKPKKRVIPPVVRARKRRATRQKTVKIPHVKTSPKPVIDPVLTEDCVMALTSLGSKKKQANVDVKELLMECHDIKTVEEFVLQYFKKKRGK